MALDTVQIGMMDPAAQNVAYDTGKVRTTPEIAGNSFGSYLKTTDASTQDAKVQETAGKGADKADSYDKYRYKDKNIESAQTDTASTRTAETKEKAEQLEKDIVKNVSDDLNVDEEKVVEAMETLGLTALDLLNPQNLASLTQTLKGDIDEVNLLLDGDFKQLLSDVAALGNEFAEETGIDPKEALASLDLTKAALEANVQQPQVQETVAETAGTQETLATERTDLPDQQPEELETAQPEAVEQETFQTEEDGQPDQFSDETDGTDLGSIETPETGTGRSENTKLSDDGTAAFSEHLTNAVSEALSNAEPAGEVPQTASYTSIDTADVIAQIVERVRISRGTDTTSIEMQLNPENLGKIYLNVSSREGAVHAQLYAQNEEVKLALEAQIATLTENLSQAGVKVDAVEVTIASHEFERNLEQNADSGEESREEANEQRTTRRALRLDGFDDPEAELSEEEALITRMMKDNGNSVDFTA